MNRPIPPALLTLYADLAQQVRWAETGGTVYWRTLGGIEYGYAKVSSGGNRRDLFLGRKDDPKTEKKVEDLQNAASAARERRKTIRLLRQGGFRTPDPWLGKILDVIAQSGLFDRGAVLVGTGAYQLMEPLIAHFLPDAGAMTSDVDVVTADLALRADSGEAFETILKRADASFSGVPQLDPGKPSSRFKAGDYFVDLLTPVLRRTDATPMPLNELAAGGAPLPYLRWLVEEPVRTVALLGAGIAVAIPAPARYAVHKLILAQRRNATSRMKRFKDLDQARFLIGVLRKADPFALEDALEDARAQGTDGWATPIARSLHELGIDL